MRKFSEISLLFVLLIVLLLKADVIVFLLGLSLVVVCATVGVQQTHDFLMSLSGHAPKSAVFERRHEEEEDSNEVDDFEEEESEEDEEEDTDVAALQDEIEDLKKRLEEANQVNVKITEEKLEVEKELKKVKEEFKRSQEDLESELEDIVRDLMKQEEKKKAAYEEAVEEAKFDRLEEIDENFADSFEMVDGIPEDEK